MKYTLPTWALTTSLLALGALALPMQKRSSFTIMPLGDSITWGDHSSDGNGYRLDLLNDLTWYSSVSGNDVGNVATGTMADNVCVAYPGRTIDEIHSNATAYLSNNQCPQLTLLHAGTNDCDRNINVSGAAQRVFNIVTDLFNKCPNMNIIVAQIIQSTNSNTQSNIDIFNPALWNILNTHPLATKQLFSWNMEYALNTSTDMFDTLHPNDAGYKKMADQWYNAILYVNSHGTRRLF